MFKKYLFFIIIFNLFFSFAKLDKEARPHNNLNLDLIKYIIWDAGSTLTQVSHLAIANELGAKYIFSMLWHIGKPLKMRQLMFQALEQYAGKQMVSDKNDILTYDDTGMPLPHFMSDIWFCSRIPNREILAHVKKAVDQWSPKESVTKAQKNLIKRTLCIALCARILGKHTCCDPQALELVKQLAKKGYKQYILSNFEKEAFEIAYKNEKNKSLFKNFPREYIVISGDCGMIKPHRCIYEYFLQRYNLDPKECLLIDDRPENVKGAWNSGMQAIHLKNGKYKKLAHKLQKILE